MAYDFLMPSSGGWLKRPRQTSPLLPLRDSTAQNQMYKMVDQINRRASQLTNIIQQLQSRIAKSERWGTVPVQGEPFYPFKIYRPNLNALPPFGVIFDQAGNGTQCTIDSTTPTNLTGATPTVNPKTDGWRIQAVRNGIVSTNFLYPLPTTVQDVLNGFNDYLYDVFDYNSDFGNPGLGEGYLHGTDGWGSFTAAQAVGEPSVPTFFEYDGQTTTMFLDPNQTRWGCPLIIDDGTTFDDPSGDQLTYAIWIEIRNNANQDTDVPVGGFSYITVKASTSGFYGNVQNGPNPNVIVPLGMIMSNDGQKQTQQNIQQVAIGHQSVTPYRYTNAALQPYQIPSTLNYAGDWQNDQGGTTPINDGRQFQPGDVVSYTDTTGSINMTYSVAGGSGGGTVTVTLKFHTEYLIMCIATNQTTNPLGDPNWLTIHQGVNTLSFA
jgi:hypothetical protein